MFFYDNTLNLLAYGVLAYAFYRYVNNEVIDSVAKKENMRAPYGTVTKPLIVEQAIYVDKPTASDPIKQREYLFYDNRLSMSKCDL